MSSRPSNFRPTDVKRGGGVMGTTEAMKVTRIRISDIAPWRCDYPPVAWRYATMLRDGHKLPPIMVIDLGGRAAGNCHEVPTCKL
jgi:hypothetical protein